MEKRKYKIHTLMVLSVALLLIAANTVYCGPNPPQGEREPHPAGPAILGSVIITPLGDGISANFSGKCKNMDVSLVSEYDISFEEVSEEKLKGFGLGLAGPLGCHSDYGGEYLYVKTVISYDDSVPDVIEAKVVLLFLVPK